MFPHLLYVFRTIARDVKWLVFTNCAWFIGEQVHRALYAGILEQALNFTLYVWHRRVMYLYRVKSTHFSYFFYCFYAWPFIPIQKFGIYSPILLTLNFWYTQNLPLVYLSVRRMTALKINFFQLINILTHVLNNLLVSQFLNYLFITYWVITYTVGLSILLYIPHYMMILFLQYIFKI